jgi:hypothetical protein
MKAIYLATAMLFSVFAVTPASAASVAPASGVQASSNLLLARYVHRPSNSDYSAKKKKSHRRFHYAPGHRYRHAPRGWHSYHSRPYNWSTRGCILVGPIWFCP